MEEWRQGGLCSSGKEGNAAGFEAAGVCATQWVSGAALLMLVLLFVLLLPGCALQTVPSCAQQRCVGGLSCTPPSTRSSPADSWKRSWPPLLSCCMMLRSRWVACLCCAGLVTAKAERMLQEGVCEATLCSKALCLRLRLRRSGLLDSPGFSAKGTRRVPQILLVDMCGDEGSVCPQREGTLTHACPLGSVRPG